MKVKYCGFIFEYTNNDNEEIEIREFVKFYKELSGMLRKDNCDYFYMPVIPTYNGKYTIAALITKDVAILRVTDETGLFHNECKFQDIKETTSSAQTKLFHLVQKHEYQPEYSKIHINRWMHELTALHKTEFIQNKEVYGKYERVRRRLEKAYGIAPSTKGIKNVDTQKTASPSDQEIRAAAFIRDNRAKADAMAAIDREIKNPANQLSDTLTARYNKTRTELSKAIYKYAAHENMSGTSEETTMETVKELFKGTGCDPEPYLRKAGKVYSEDIRDIKDIKEQKSSSIKLF